MFINTQISNIKYRRERESGDRNRKILRSPSSGFRSPDFYFSANEASNVFAELVPTNTLKSPGSLTSFRSLL